MMSKTSVVMGKKILAAELSLVTCSIIEKEAQPDRKNVGFEERHNRDQICTLTLNTLCVTYLIL